MVHRRQARPLPALRHLLRALLRTCQHAPVRPAHLRGYPRRHRPAPRRGHGLPRHRPTHGRHPEHRPALHRPLRQARRALPRLDGPGHSARADPGRRGLVLRGEQDKNRDPLDPLDAERRSFCDHVIIDPESKLIVRLALGRRDAAPVVQLFTDCYDRTDGYLPELICTDEYAVYQTVILDTYGVCKSELELTPEEEAEFSLGDFHFPEEVSYATVQKHKEGGRVVAVSERLVLGSEERLEQTLEESERSRTVNTSFVERYHGTHRHFNARKRRKAYTFSKELCFHEAATWLVVLWYNFGRCVRTLRQKVQDDPPRYHHRTPAMAAGLADHAWTMGELLRYPLYPPAAPRPTQPPRTYKDVLERLKGVIDAQEASG